MKQVSIDNEWYDVPDRAQYMAQDESGDWFWYRKKPHLYGGYWSSKVGMGYIYVAHIAPPEDYTQELYELIDVDDVRHTCSEHFVCLHELSAHCPPAGLSCFCPKCTPK